MTWKVSSGRDTWESIKQISGKNSWCLIESSFMQKDVIYLFFHNFLNILWNTWKDTSLCLSPENYLCFSNNFSFEAFWLTLVLNNYSWPNLDCCCLNGPCDWGRGIHDIISIDPEQILVGTVAFEVISQKPGNSFLSVCLSILKCQLWQSEFICALKGPYGKVRASLSQETLPMSCRRSRLCLQPLSPYIIVGPFFIWICAFSIVDGNPGIL